MGATGMLGHQMYWSCSKQFETFATIRGNFKQIEPFGYFDRKYIIEGTLVQDSDTLVTAFERAQPDVVINCIGIIKQTAEAKDPVQSLTVNSLFHID